MTFSEFMHDTRDTFRNGVNEFLAERNLEQVRILDSLVGIEKRPLTLCVFPTASSGSTFEEQDGSNAARFTVQFYCNNQSTEKGLAQCEEYYSALLEFIQRKTFGDSSSIDASAICRMDEGEVVNGAIFLITSRISSNMDFGWD